MARTLQGLFLHVKQGETAGGSAKTLARVGPRLAPVTASSAVLPGHDLRPGLNAITVCTVRAGDVARTVSSWYGKMTEIRTRN
jgi:hypothetical protein